MPDYFWQNLAQFLTGEDIPKAYAFEQNMAPIMRGFNTLAQGDALATLKRAPVRVNDDGSGLVEDGDMDALGYAFMGYRIAEPESPLLGGLSTPLTGSFTITSTNCVGYTGRVIYTNVATAHTITINASVGDFFCAQFVQLGAGILSIAGAGGLSLFHRLNHTKSAGQKAVIGLWVRSPNIHLVGDTTV